MDQLLASPGQPETVVDEDGQALLQEGEKKSVEPGAVAASVLGVPKLMVVEHFDARAPCPRRVVEKLQSPGKPTTSSLVTMVDSECSSLLLDKGGAPPPKPLVVQEWMEGDGGGESPMVASMMKAVLLGDGGAESPMVASWMKAVLLEGEAVVHQLACVTMKDMPKLDGVKVGEGMLMLTKLKERHRLHIYMMESDKTQELQEQWKTKSEAVETAYDTKDAAGSESSRMEVITGTCRYSTEQWAFVQTAVVGSVEKTLRYAEWGARRGAKAGLTVDVDKTSTETKSSHRDKARANKSGCCPPKCCCSRCSCSCCRCLKLPVCCSFSCCSSCSCCRCLKLPVCCSFSCCSKSKPPQEDKLDTTATSVSTTWAASEVHISSNSDLALRKVTEQEGQGEMLNAPKQLSMIREVPTQLKQGAVSIDERVLCLGFKEPAGKRTIVGKVTLSPQQPVSVVQTFVSYLGALIDDLAGVEETWEGGKLVLSSQVKDFTLKGKTNK